MGKTRCSAANMLNVSPCTQLTGPVSKYTLMHLVALKCIIRSELGDNK